MAQFSPESWLRSNRNGGSRRPDRWLKIACNIQQDKKFIERFIKEKKKHLIIASAVIVIGFTIIYIFNQAIRIHPIRFFVAIAVAYLLYILVQHFPKHLRVMELIARYSLQIMFFDGFYRVVLFSVMGRVIPINGLIAIVIAVLTIFLGVVSCLIIEKIPYLRKAFGL